MNCLFLKKLLRMGQIILVLFVLTQAVFAADSTKTQSDKQSKNKSGFSDVGAFFELSSFDEKDAILKYQMAGQRYHVDLDLSNVYGVRSSFFLHHFFSLYGILSYQYAEVLYQAKNLNAAYALTEKYSDLDSSDIKGHSDIHQLALDLGMEFHITLYESLFYPFKIKLNGTLGLLGGYAFHQESLLENTRLWGYTHSVSFRFDYGCIYIMTGLNWTHLYSHAYADEDFTNKRDESSFMSEYDRSGRLFISLGYIFSTVR